MASATPYNNISSFMAFRSDAERASYEDIRNLNKNWFDRASYSEFVQYEKNILRFTKKLHNNYFKWGFLTVDSSEAIYCVLLIHLLRSGKRGKDPNFVISKLGHTSFKKAAVLLGVEIREVEILENGNMDPDDLAKKINSNTFCVIALAGSTPFGNYDNIIEIDKTCSKLDIPLHIDAAIGGFIYPFRENSKIHSDFNKFNAVASVNISGHKYGYSRPSVGILLLRDKSLLPTDLYSSSVPYLRGKNTEEFGLLGSKSPIGLIDLNFNVTHWKEIGYAKIVDKVFKQKEKIIKELNRFDKLNILDSKDTPILLISGDEKILKDLKDYLTESGWHSSINKLYKNKPSIRIVVRNHFDNTYVNGLLNTVEYFFKNHKST